MYKFFDWLIKRKIVLLCAASIVFVISALGVVGCFLNNGKLDRDIYSMFDRHGETAEGIAFLEETFGIYGNAIYVVRGNEQDAELGNMVQKSLTLEGVSACLWYGNFENAAALQPLVNLYADGQNIDTQPLTDYLRRDRTDGGYDYLLLYFFDESVNADASFGLLNDLDGIFDGREFAKSGLTPLEYDFSAGLMRAFFIMMLIVAGLCLLIAIVIYKDLRQFFVVAIWAVFAIIVNVGLQYAVDKTYELSLACSCAVQALLIVISGAVLVNDVFKSKEGDPAKRMARAFAIRFVPIAIGILFSLLGAVVLSAVSFGFTKELGMLMLRGIFVSILSFFLLVPALCSVFEKEGTGRKKTAKKPVFRRISNVLCSHFRKVVVSCVILFVLLAAFTSFAFDSLDLLPSKDSDSTARIANAENRQLLLMLPIDVRDGYTHSEFIDELEALPFVEGVMSGYTALELDRNKMYDVLAVLESGNSDLFRAISALYGSRTDNGVTKRYVIYAVTFNISFEDEYADQAYAELNEIIDEFFDERHSVGLWTGVRDVSLGLEKDIYMLLWALLIIVAVCVLISLRSIFTGLAACFSFALAAVTECFILSHCFESINIVVFFVAAVLQLIVFLPEFLFVTAEAKRSLFSNKGAAYSVSESFHNTIGTFLAIDTLIILSAFVGLIFISDLVLIEFLTAFGMGAVLTLASLVFVLPAALMSATDLVDFVAVTPDYLVHMFPMYVTNRIARTAKRSLKKQNRHK